MRYSFGGGVADWVFAPVVVGDADNIAQLRAGATVTFWSAESGGVQYTDLLDGAGQPTSSVTTSDGTDGRSVGQIPVFQGPEDVAAMWAEANGGPRALVIASNLASRLVDLAGDLAEHENTTNPHSTTLTSLADVSLPGVEVRVGGQALRWDAASQKFVLGAAVVEETNTGVVPASGFSVTNFTGRKTNGVCTVWLYLAVNTAVAASSGNITPDLAAATLPVGWRPAQPTSLIYSGGAQDGEALLNPSGVLELRTSSGSLTNTTSLRFHATFVL